MLIIKYKNQKLVNAVTSRREYTILFNRVAIFILLYSGIIGHGSLYVTCLDTGIGIYNGLFHSTAITHSVDLFIYIIAPIILLLTGFYARHILAIEFQNYWLFIFVTFIISTTTVCPLSFSSEWADFALLFNIVPAVSYSDADVQKLTIYKENKNKSGIYRWTNKTTGSSYIGSALNLSRRFTNYYSLKFVNREVNKGNSIISRALLKYGYSNFKLDILEYCDSSVLIEKEQYYLDKLNPKYNILTTAGSIAGYRHSEASLELIRAAILGKKHSDETKEKMRGRKHTEATRAKIGANNYKIQPVVATNIETGVSFHPWKK